ncbi:MAG: peptidoglycan DD-metalloendopeptidase family protein [Bdellovibrionales bacterium]
MSLPPHILSGTIPYNYRTYAPVMGMQDSGVHDFRSLSRTMKSGFRRLGQRTRISAFALLIAAIGLPMVPWQADDAASTRLAAMFNNQPFAMATVASATPMAMAMVTLTEDTAERPAMSTAPVMEEKTLALTAGQTLGGLLQSLDIVTGEANSIAAELRRVFDIRRLKAGQKFNMVLQRDGEKNQLVSMNFSASSTKEIKLERQNDGSYDAVAAVIPTSLKRLATTGTISGSLYQSASAAGLPQNVMTDVMKMFAHAVDFQRDIHPGDKFQVMYDQKVTARGDNIGDGQVIFATIETGGKSVRMYRYEYEKGQFDYFDESGKTAKRGLLRTPVDGARITSRFGMRNHPLLGYSKMHAGIDFGASAGTPIYAAGDGTITKLGWNGSYGKYVQIRHNGNISTAYAHASGFPRSLKVGDKVKQGQVIAYVGSTGRSTGPHLHYEIHVNGRKVNPMTVNIPTGRSLNKTEMATFKRWQDQIQSEFNLALKGVNPITGPTNVAHANN